jgi:hypothetical protein
LPVKSPEILEATPEIREEAPVSVSVEIETITIETSDEIIEFTDSTVEIQEEISNKVAEAPRENPKPEVVVGLNEVKVSALSLKSIRAKKELEQSSKAAIKDDVHLPTEEFNETDMLLQWTKYAQRLSDKGHKIMESLLLINDPKLKGTTIVHELPNEGSKIDFETGKHELLGYLRGKLHNHDIDIKVIVNESMDSRKAFTPQDRYNRLNEINPSLELLRKTFDLDF